MEEILIFLIFYSFYNCLMYLLFFETIQKDGNVWGYNLVFIQMGQYHFQEINGQKIPNIYLQ